MEWVLKTMLPPEKRRLIVEEVQSAFHEHHEEIVAALKPIVRDSVRESLGVVREDLLATFKRWFLNFR